jgi:hypothetical protein
MTNFFRTVLAAGLLIAGAAQADESKVITIDKTSPAARTQLVQTAIDVCRKALQTDVFGDFGSLDECVENTLEGVHPVNAEAKSANVQVSSAR